MLGTGEQRLAGIFAGAYPVDALDEVEMADGEFGPIVPGARHQPRVATSSDPKRLASQCWCEVESTPSRSHPTRLHRSCTTAVAIAGSKLRTEAFPAEATTRCGLATLGEHG